MVRIFIILTILIFIPLKAFSIPEKEINERTLSWLEQIDAIAETHSFLGVGQMRIHYSIFHFESESPPPQRGGIVISPGRTEPSLKYVELAYDLMKRGFYPAYVIDHRGQGASERFLQTEVNGGPGHLDRWEHAVSDFTQFVHEIVLPRHSPEKPLFLATSSMGSMIAGHYLIQPQAHEVFSATVMGSPMIDIDFPGLDFLVWAYIRFKCGGEKGCAQYTPMGHHYREKDRNFSDNDLTHSEARYDFFTRLLNTYPQLRLGSPTNGWVVQAIQGAQRLRDSAGDILSPLLIFRAGLESVVDKDAMDDFCSRIDSCEIEEVPNALHEIWHEIGPIRSQAINSSVRFFETFLTNP